MRGASEKLALVKQLLAACCFIVPASQSLHAQASGTALRKADLQFGLGYVNANSDYAPGRLKGGAFYTTFDVTSHLGAEFVVHQANANQANVYERSYELGPRYYRTYGHLKPYAKAMYGRGVFNYPYNQANLAYNLFAVGGGADYAILPWLNLRGDFEFQRWLSFPPTGLTPTLITVGVAYHFPGGLKSGRRGR